jgi:hypothetical protein
MAEATEKRVLVELSEEQKAQIHGQIGHVEGASGLDEGDATTKLEIIRRDAAGRVSIALMLQND